MPGENFDRFGIRPGRSSFLITIINAEQILRFGEFRWFASDIYHAAVSYDADNSTAEGNSAKSVSVSTPSGLPGIVVW